MKFAQFYHNSTGYIEGTIPPKFSPDHVKLIPACGSDSILFLDGRYSMQNSAAQARDVCRKRGYKGFSIHEGESLLRERIIRHLEEVQ